MGQQGRYQACASTGIARYAHAMRLVPGTRLFVFDFAVHARTNSPGWRCGDTDVRAGWYRHTPRNQIQENAFLAQIVLRSCILVFDFAVDASSVPGIAYRMRSVVAALSTPLVQLTRRLLAQRVDRPVADFPHRPLANF
eukprot:2099084-Rhodomonas_salina.1